MNKREKDRELEIKEARRELKKYIRPHTVVYTLLRNCSASGMSRRIDVYVIRQNKPWRLTHLVAKLLGYSQSKSDYALVVGGCGMDMGFHVVYSMGRMLWPHGTRKPHGERNGEPDREGGYAIKHSWL
jgi:hypothetical protein